jgi:hypothetical protein
VLTLATAAFLLHQRAWDATALCCLSSEDRRGTAILGDLPHPRT